MKTITTILLALIYLNLVGQTDIQGGIYHDSTLTLEKSPYQVVGDIVVFPDKTLTIEPGVEVIFEDDYYFEIRGKLIAKGTIDEKIIFRTLNDSIIIDSLPWEQFDWEADKIGLIFDYSTSSLDISYCFFSKFKKAICLYNIAESEFIFQNCEFNMNNYGLVNFSNNRLISLDSCEFTANSVGIYTGYSKIQNGLFTNNYYGIRGWHQNNVFQSDFVNNSIGIDEGSYGLIKDCNFEENNIAVINSWAGIEMENNIISNNIIGIRFNLSDTTNINMIRDNKFYENIQYNIENTSSTNIALNSNCWCTGDSLEIENKLYDGYDNINSGLINYDIFNESCSSVLKSVTKVNIATSLNFPVNNLSLSIYPNPFNDYITLSNLELGNYRMRLYDLSGKIIIHDFIRGVNQYAFNTEKLIEGIYILELDTDTKLFRKKMVK